MTKIDVFQIQFLLSLLAVALVGAVLVRPFLAGLDKRRVLLVLTVPHMFRHMGMAFLVPGLVDEGLPTTFSIPAAYGDLATGALALSAFIALAARLRWGAVLFGVFNIVGLVDLARALPQVEMAAYFNVVWYIPTVLVPVLLVTHVMGLVSLFRRAESGAAAATHAYGAS